MSEMAISKKVELEQKIAEYNKALNAKNLDAMVSIEADVAKLEAEYNEQSQLDLFSECKKAENPMLEGIKRYTYPILRHSIEKDDVGRPVSMSLVEGREKQINLIKLAKFCELDTMWQYRVEEMGELLCLRMAKLLGVPTEELKAISKTYRMDKKAQRMEAGETPASTNKVCKLLQTVVDSIIYEDDGKEKNKYKVNSHDVAYLDFCYGRRDNRKKLTISVANKGFLITIVTDVLHRVACDLVYSVNYKKTRVDEDDKKADKVFADKASAKDAPKDEPATVEVERPATEEQVA